MLGRLMEKVRDVIDIDGGPSRAAPDGADLAEPAEEAEAPAVDEVATSAPDGAEASASPQGDPASSSPQGDPASSSPQGDPASSSPQGDPASTDDVDAAAISQPELERITADVVKGLKTVYDPEIPVDVYELGLIYKVDLSDERLLTIDMTLTAPGCPVAGEMPGWVEGSVRGIDGVDDVKVNMVFDPPWTPDRMSDEAKLELGMM